MYFGVIYMDINKVMNTKGYLTWKRTRESKGWKFF